MATLTVSQRKWYRRNRPPLRRPQHDGAARPGNVGTKHGGIVVRRDRKGRATS